MGEQWRGWGPLSPTLNRFLPFIGLLYSVSRNVSREESSALGKKSNLG